MAAAASRAEEGEGKGLLAVSWAALDELAEMDNGLSSELELGELTPPVAVALEANVTDLGDREAALRTTPRIKRAWQNQYLR